MTPLRGLRVLEFEGLGPGPVAGMILSRLGAQVVLVKRPKPLALKGDTTLADPIDGLKQAITIDLKHERGIEAALKLVETVDALIEGNRPGVMERLGLGPEVCEARNPRLVYGRITGWGQDGPLSQAAGHDLNYVALTGLLSLSARAGTQPIVPPTVLGDGAGALGFAFGLVCGVYEAAQTGRGRVVDAAMVDITAMIGTLVSAFKMQGAFTDAQPTMFHGSHFYEVYECADGKSVTIAALEPKFYAELLERLGLDQIDPARQYDAATWPDLKRVFSTLFKTKTRSEWSELLEGTDVCFAPVLSLDEAASHPQMRARGTFTTLNGHPFPGVAPRFLGTYDNLPPAPDARKLLAESGFSESAIDELRACGAVKFL